MDDRVLAVFAAVFDLSGPQRFIEWGWFRITIPNLVVIGLVAAAFAVGVIMRMRSE